MNNMKFADMLKRLDEIANILDNGDASLEQSLELFEEASALIKQCNLTINDARLKLVNMTKSKEENINE